MLDEYERIEVERERLKRQMRAAQAFGAFSRKGSILREIRIDKSADTHIENVAANYWSKLNER